MWSQEELRLDIPTIMDQGHGSVSLKAFNAKWVLSGLHMNLLLHPDLVQGSISA